MKNTTPIGTLQEELDEVHKDMLLVAMHDPDFERAHREADNYLTRLVKLLAHGQDPKIQRVARLTLQAYDRVQKYCA